MKLKVILTLDRTSAKLSKETKIMYDISKEFLYKTHGIVDKSHLSIRDGEIITLTFEFAEESGLQDFMKNELVQKLAEHIVIKRDTHK